MSLAQLFYAKQALRRALRWARDAHRHRKMARRQPHAMHFESLEPRLLLSGSATLLTPVPLTRVADLQPAAVEGAQFPPGTFSATAGSEVHENFLAAAEVDAFYFDANAGQKAAFELMPQHSSIRGRIEVLDPNGVSLGAVDAGSAGGYVLLQNMTLPQTGRYTVEFESLQGAGNYDADVFFGTGLGPQPGAITTSWINAAGGNWSTPSNWSTGLVPTSSDVVGITLNGTYTVTLDVSSTISGLVLGGTTGTQSLTINGTSFTLTGASSVQTQGVLNLNSGTMTGAGALNIDGRLNWTGGAMTGAGLTVIGPGGIATISNGAHDLNRVLENQGTTTWSAGPLQMNNGTLLNKGTFVAAGGASTIQSYGVGGTNRVFNQGTFLKQGTGIAQFQVSTTGVSFDNQGTVNVQAGSLSLLAGGTHSGDFTLTGGTLFTNGTHTFQSTSDVTGGTLRIDGGTATFAGAVQVAAITSNGATTFGPVETAYLAIGTGTTTINTLLSLNQVDMVGGTLAGTGNVTVTGVLNWTGGAMAGTGRTVIGPAGTATINSATHDLNRVLENQGTATWSAGALQMNNGTLLNLGTFIATTASTLDSSGLGGTNRVTNQGTFRKQGTGTAQFRVSNTAVAFDNQGLVEVQGGSLRLDAGGTHSGDFTITGATLFTMGTHVFQSTSDVTGGTLRIDGGTASFAGAVQVGAITSNGTTTFGPVLSTTYLAVGTGTTTINTPLSMNQLDMVGGTLTGSGNITVTGVLNWTGGTMAGTGRTILGPTATLAMNGGGTVTLSRILENQGTATWSAGALQFISGQVLNTGTFIATSGGTLSGFGGPGGVNNRFTNQGTFRKQGAGLTQLFTSSTAVAFDNSGLVEVQGGTLLLDSAGGTHSGDFTIAAGTTLQLDGPHSFQSTSDVSGGGTVQVINSTGTSTSTFGGTLAPAALVISGGTVNVNVTTQVTNLSVSGGTLSGTGNVTAIGNSTWTGGTMAGTGRTILGPTAALALNGGGTVTLSRVLENQGTATWSAGAIQFISGQVLNTGTFIATSGGTLSGFGGPGGVNNRFTNQGTFRKQGAGLTQFFTSSTTVAFDNSGLVEVQGGTLNLGSAGGTHSGDFTIAAGTTLQLDGIHIFQSTSDVTGTTPGLSGTVQVQNGTTTFSGTLTPGALVLSNSGTATVNVAAQMSNLSINNSSILNGSGTLTATGASTWTGGTMSGTGRTIIGPSGTLALTGTTNTMTVSRVLENQGTATWSAGSLQFISGQILNTGTFVATSGGTLSSFGGPAGVNNQFINQGTFRKQGVGITQFSVSSTGVTFDNQGTVDVQAGTLNLFGGLTNFSGTTLTGGTWLISGTLQITGADIATNAATLVLNGTAQLLNQSSVNALANFSVNAATGSFTLSGGRDFSRTGNFINQGALALGPGSAFSVTGAFTQTSTGTYKTQISGPVASTGYGQLTVGGAAALDGALTLELTGGFVPSLGQTFTVLTFASRTGDFATVTGLNFAPGFRFRRDLTSTAMTLTVIEDVATPGPTVTSSNPAEGAIAPSGNLTYVAQFSEPLATTNLGAEDVRLRDKLTGVNYTPGTFNYDAGANQLTVTYTTLPESDYALTLVSSDTGFRNASGARLDGDADGREGGDFVVNFILDAGTAAFPGSFQASKPLGSLIQSSTPFLGRFHAAGDTDLYDLALDPGQTVTVRLGPQGPSIQGRIEFLAPDGTTVLGSSESSTAGSAVILQTVPTAAAGTYRIRLSSVSGPGAYQIAVTLNSAVEAEQFGGGTNNTAATAQDITASSIALQGSGSRLAVTGVTEAGQDDYYRFDLAAGQAATLVLSASDLDAQLALELRDAGNVVLTSGIKETVNVENQAIRNFVAPTAGPYTVRISGEANRAYSLVITRSGEFDREANSTAASAQEISQTGQVLGSLGYRTEATPGAQVKVAVVGTTDASYNTHFTPIVTQLNNDTFFDFQATLVTPSQVDTVAELNAYDVVLIASTGNNPPKDDFEVYAPALRQWVTAGGGLVATGWTVYGSGPGTGSPVLDIDAIVPVNTAGGHNAFFGSSGTLPPVTIGGTVHPVTAGVSTITLSPALSDNIEFPAQNPKVDPGALILGTASGQPVIVVGNIGATGRTAYLGPAYPNAANSTGDLRTGQGDRLLEQALGWAAAVDRQDQYLVRVNAGDTLTITTTTPGDGPNFPMNTLNPSLELYNRPPISTARPTAATPESRIRRRPPASIESPSRSRRASANTACRSLAPPAHPRRLRWWGKACRTGTCERRILRRSASTLTATR
jgi:hypothetical protein